MLKSLEFWIAVGVAVVVKIKTSQRLNLWQVVTTIAVAVGAAYVGTEWTQARTGLPEPVAAALVALTAEGLMRWLLLALDDPRRAIELWREWRK
ncbi:MAG: hypothetical protein ACK4S2_15310 [Gemmobacter sp.]|uniref:hypothetical protein n=1 Tax=Gemmobacter sp. TaxID=1898957 RepID=UPI0039189F65